MRGLIKLSQIDPEFDVVDILGRLAEGSLLLYTTDDPNEFHLLEQFYDRQLQKEVLHVEGSFSPNGTRFLFRTAHDIADIARERDIDTVTYQSTELGVKKMVENNRGMDKAILEATSIVKTKYAVDITKF